MKCLECRVANREGVKFCESCGARMELLCPDCGAKIPLDRSFCGECGRDLRRPTEPLPIDYSQPQSYTPQYLAEKILTTRSSIEGERKFVTVLFVDVANYTSISEKLDPEEVHQIMDGCFKILMGEIHRYEGTINQFTGDGVMALFGAPLAHEDHAQRGCHASLAIRKSIEGYGEKIKRQHGAEFKLRMGLNSGLVIVGSIGDDLRMDYTAVGDTTNMAHRLQDLAKPGSVLVSRNTRRLAMDFFEFTSLGKVEVKGKEEPQEAYELIRPSEFETRIEAAAAKGLTRFVGRVKELDTLKEAFERARSGSGQVIGVVGEAGVGKSRLLLELRGLLAEGEYSYLEGRCLHYGGSMPYLPVLDVLKGYFGIKDDTQESWIKEKVRECMSILHGEPVEIPACLQEVLSLKVDDDKYLQLGPQQRRERTFEAIRDLLVRESRRKPLILAIEDLHWIDKTSEEFLHYLIGVLPKTNLLLILLYRPEYTHTWGSKSYYSKIGLDQLSAHTSAELVQAILSGEDVAPEIGALVLGRAGGNPLFVEELTHSLVENGSIQRKVDRFVLARRPSEIQVPDTIQGIIAARMDRIEDNLKRIMQVASVIGREFAYRVLQAITDMREDLKNALVNLQGLEFIYEKQLFPELEYIFKHALTQEVAYNSLLSRRKREIHEKIGKAIEELYSERLDEQYGLLAYHYVRSDNKPKAVEHLIMANRKAVNAIAVEEAKSYFDECMKLLDTMPDTKQTRENRISLLVDSYIVFQLLLRIPDYHALLTQYEPIVAGIDSAQLQGAFYASMGNCEYLFGSYDSAIQTSRRGAELCELAGDAEGTGRALTCMQMSHLWKGDLERSLALKEDVLRMSDEQFSVLRYVRASAAYSLTCAFLGRWEEAVDVSRKAFNIAEESEDSSHISFAAWTMSFAYAYKGDLTRAIQFGEMAVQEAPTPADKAWAEGVLALAWCRAGKTEKGVPVLEALLPVFKASRVMVAELPCRLFLGEGYWLEGQLDKGAETLEELVQTAGRCGAKGYLGQAHRLLGEIALETDAGLAATLFEKAISIFSDMQAENELALAYSGMGRLHKQQRNTEQAREYLTKSLGIFDRLGTLIEPDRVREALSDL